MGGGGDGGKIMLACLIDPFELRPRKPSAWSRLSESDATCSDTSWSVTPSECSAATNTSIDFFAVEHLIFRSNDACC